MKAGTVASRVRFYIRDTSKNITSDWEIYESINEALRIIAEVNSKSKGGIFRKSETIVISDGRGLLPEDFLDVNRVFSSDGKEMLAVFSSTPGTLEYSTDGMYIYSGEPSVTIFYFSFHPQILNDISDIEIPESYFTMLARATALVVSGDPNGALNLVASILTGTPMEASGNGMEASGDGGDGK